MKKTIITVLVLSFFVSTEALAFCTWGIVPEEKQYQPLDATEAFLSYENGVQTLVLQPEWQGDVTDFAIVYPTPSRPEISAGPRDLFWQLDSATNPFVAVPMAATMEDSDAELRLEAAEAVTVVEEKQVGEYEVTVLTATDATALAEWLEEHDYNYTSSDAEKVSYYVDQGGFYFIALKVDASHFAPVWLEEDDGFELEREDVSSNSSVRSHGLMMAPPNWFWGELSPIQFTFETDAPQLPMRTLKSDMERMTFDLYTLGTEPLYVPGVDTVWSNLVDAAFLNQVPTLADYNPKGKWLLRQEVSFSPQNSDADLYLTIGDASFTMVDAGNQVRFDPATLDPVTGILAGTRGRVVHTNAITGVHTFTRSLTIGASGEDVRALQVRLNAEGFIVSETGPGSIGNESMYFGEKTKAALIKYQNFYRADVLEPVGLQVGTGYFGPSTMRHMNGQ